ncbi:MAG: MerR family transcriptional regulator, partial [Methylovirgula sp.]
MAREFRVSLRALRFYEDRGLLHPRRNGTARLYSGRDRLHLQMILKAKQLGFTLAEIREILARGDGEADLNLPADQIAAQIGHLERQLSSVEAALAELRRVHE